MMHLVFCINVFKLSFFRIVFASQKEEVAKLSCERQCASSQNESLKLQIRVYQKVCEEVLQRLVTAAVTLFAIARPTALPCYR